MAKKSFVDWLYTTAPGRMTLKVLLYTGALKLGEMVARSQLSKPFISRYIKTVSYTHLTLPTICSV